MTTSEYRDQVDGLRDAIGSFKSCVNFEEREAAAKRIQNWWRRLSLLGQPRRLPKSEADRCTRYLRQAADLLNNWLIEVESGAADVVEERAPAPEKAMADTMRFCANMKKFGF